MIRPRRAGFGDGQRDAFAELEFPHARRQRGSGFERDGRRHDAHVRIFFEQQLQDLGENAAYEQIMLAVSDFEKGNLRLSTVLTSMNG